MYILLKFDSLEKMRITSLESKYILGISGKGLITYLSLKSKAIPNNYKKARYANENFSKKELSNIIRDFDKLLHKSYKRMSPKHEPTESYFYPTRHISKHMMRSDALNLHVYPVRTEITAMKQILISHVVSTKEKKFKEFLVKEILSQICSTDEDESKGIIVDKCSTE